MPERCANPLCNALFNLRGGHLFQFEIRTASISCQNEGKETQGEELSREVAHFWLCSECSATMTLALKPEAGVEIQQLRPSDSPKLCPEA